MQNAKLFDDVQNMRNYSEAMLASMSNGVITVDKSGVIATCNEGGGAILGIDRAAVVGRHWSDVFGNAEGVIGALVKRVWPKTRCVSRSSRWMSTWRNSSMQARTMTCRGCR